MSSSNYKKVVVHQGAPSISSSASRSTASYRTSSSSVSTMDSRASSSYSTARTQQYREFDANKHRSSTTERKGVVVHNHGKGVDERGAPHPGYYGSYTK